MERIMDPKELSPLMMKTLELLQNSGPMSVYDRRMKVSIKDGTQIILDRLSKLRLKGLIEFYGTPVGNSPGEFVKITDAGMTLVAKDKPQAPDLYVILKDIVEKRDLARLRKFLAENRFKLKSAILNRFSKDEMDWIIKHG
jgi:DNA-binding PadR family transcriptional regulator